MKIAYITRQVTSDAEKEINLLKTLGWQLEITNTNTDLISQKLIELKGVVDLVYVYEDIELAAEAAKIKYILQVPLVYRQLKNIEKKQPMKLVLREADKIVFADNSLEKDWADLKLDIYEQKEVLGIADPKLNDLFKKLIEINCDYDFTICFFGSFDQFCTRNRVLLKGFAKNRIKAIKLNDNSSKFKKYINLWRMHSKIKDDYDIMFAAFQGQIMMPLTWLLARLNRKKIIFDALFSLYDSVVLDRREIEASTLRAKFLFFLDWLASRLADVIIVHTEFHQEFFTKEFRLEKHQDKFMTLYVGADDELIYPKPDLWPKTEPFVVHFHGSYLPAQGLEHVIIGAAKILKNENVIFNLIGRGKSYPEVRKLAEDYGLTKVNFIDPVPYRVLGDYMSKSDCCLGSFGTSPKIMRVVPLKVFESLASGRALITARTPAVLKLLTERENCLLTELGDPRDLADKIIELKNNPEFKEKIALSGYQLFKNNLTPKATVKRLKDLLVAIYEADKK